MDNAIIRINNFKELCRVDPTKLLQHLATRFFQDKYVYVGISPTRNGFLKRIVELNTNNRQYGGRLDFNTKNHPVSKSCNNTTCEMIVVFLLHKVRYFVKKA